MIKEFQAFFTLFKQGKALANSAAWKNRTIAANSLTAVLGAALVIGKGFGYDIHLDEQTVEALAGGIAAAVAAVNAVMHVVTSDKVGVSAQRPADDYERDPREG